MALHLGAWAVTMGLGVPGMLTLWPVVVYALFLAVPRLRPHLKWQRYPERVGPVSAWLMSGSIAAVSVQLTRLPVTSALPPAENSWNQDLYWHLGLAQLFMRQLAPEDSQVAGTSLAYHWFADADVAATALATGLSPAAVLTRLSSVTVVLIGFALLMGVAREITDRHPQMLAALAGVLLAGKATLAIVPWAAGPGSSTFVPLSPSQNYSYPWLLLTLLLVVRWLRGGPPRTLAVLAVILLLAPGVKATHLPVVVSGLAFALAVMLLVRGPRRRIVLLLGTSILALFAGSLLIGAGGSAGSAVQILSSLRRSDVYLAQAGLSAAEAALPGGLIPAGIGHPGAAQVLLLAAVAAAVHYAWVLPGLAVSSRRDAVPAFLFGSGLSGWALMMLIDQSGLSQVYFMSTAVVMWFLLAAWGAVVLWDRQAVVGALGARVAWMAIGVSAVAAAWWSIRRLAGAGLPEGDIPTKLLWPVLLGCLLLACLLGLGWWAFRREGTPLPALTFGLVAGLIVVSILPGLQGIQVAEAEDRTTPLVSRAETDAALWIDTHGGPHDIVATNVHCRGSTDNGRCDARAFWVSALTGRRTLVGSWGYLDQTRARGGEGGRPSPQQPFHDEQLFDLNEAAFRNPSVSVMEALRARGEEWLFADTRSGPVSVRLGEFADLVYSTEDVRIYRVRTPSTTP